MLCLDRQRLLCMDQLRKSLCLSILCWYGSRYKFYSICCLLERKKWNYLKRLARRWWLNLKYARSCNLRMLYYYPLTILDNSVNVDDRTWCFSELISLKMRMQGILSFFNWRIRLIALLRGFFTGMIYMSNLSICSDSYLIVRYLAMGALYLSIFSRILILFFGSRRVETMLLLVVYFSLFWSSIVLWSHDQYLFFP